MVSTREILYVLLISLAAGGLGLGGISSESELGGYSGYGASALLPLLLLLLFSTDNPCGCGDGCGGTCGGTSPCCGGNNNRVSNCQTNFR